MPDEPGKTLPLVGKVTRKQLLIGGGAAVVVGGYIWWRHKATAAAVPADVADAGAVDDTGITGGGGAGGGGALTDPSVSAGAGIATNSQWTLDVMSKLDGVLDPGALSAALGRYLAGETVNTDQHTMVDQARAVSGDPPVAGATGYPPAVRDQPASGQTPPGGGVTGGTLPTPAGPHVVSATKTTITVRTGTVAGATFYEWLIGGHQHAHTTVPTYKFTGLHAGGTYALSVMAANASGHSAASGITTAHTTK
jgi:hypothetical protein